MIENWQMVYSSSFIHQAELTQAVLKDFDIEVVLVNKKDSAYLIGEIELFVHPDNVMRAKQIINREKL
jgi:hypothetical protein